MKEPISKLWATFELKSKGIIYDKWMEGLPNDHPSKKNFRMRFHQFQALRSELLERCENDFGMNIVGLMIWHDPQKVGFNGPKNYGSAWLFLDWELDQRQKELQP
jgi:hypothetical protein